MTWIKLRTGVRGRPSTHLVVEELKNADICARCDRLECHTRINKRMYILILAIEQVVGVSHNQISIRFQKKKNKNNLQVIISRLNMVAPSSYNRTL